VAANDNRSVQICQSVRPLTTREHRDFKRAERTMCGAHHYLALACVLTLACLVPMGFGAPLNGAGDAILFIYLLTL
jgi:formate hydrogenlyase subunit 4